MRLMAASGPVGGEVRGPRLRVVSRIEQDPQTTRSDWLSQHPHVDVVERFDHPGFVRMTGDLPGNGARFGRSMPLYRRTTVRAVRRQRYQSLHRSG